MHHQVTTFTGQQGSTAPEIHPPGHWHFESDPPLNWETCVTRTPERTLGLRTKVDASHIDDLKDWDVAGFDFVLDTSAVRHIEHTVTTPLNASTSRTVRDWPSWGNY